jgi:hypothetical protein
VVLEIARISPAQDTRRIIQASQFSEEQGMYLRIIDGGLQSAEVNTTSPLSAHHVHAEAARRLRAAGYNRSHMRQLATGEPIPKPLQYLKLQIGWVAETLAGLDPIPADYAHDKYWPG